MHPILQRLTSVRRLACRVVWWHAAGCFLLAASLALAAFAAIDYVLRPADSISRGMLSAGLGFVLVWSAKRWLLPAWQYQPSLLETATRVEERYPELTHRLSASLQFLQLDENAPSAGSSQLRERAIAITTQAMEPLRLSDVIAIAPFQRAAACLLIATALPGGWLLISPTSFFIATGRIALPWQNTLWPQQHQLEFVAVPALVARGSDVSLSVRDRVGRLPARVELLVRGEGRHERHEMKMNGDRARARLENVVAPLEIKAIGGDDTSLAWHRVDVVDPPRILDLQLKVQPPDYAGLPSATQETSLKVLAGSQLQLSGAFDRAVRSVAVVDDESGDRCEFTLADGGQRFDNTMSPASWRPQKNGVWQLIATGNDDVKYPSLHAWEIRLVPDLPPQIQLEKPVARWSLTPQAIVPLAGIASDDLGLKRITARLTSTTLKEPVNLALWSHAARAEHPDGSPIVTTSGDRVTFAGLCALKSAASFQPGDVITLEIEAFDHQPQVGKSSPLKYTLLSFDELLARLAKRKQVAHTAMAAALDSQRASRELVGKIAPRDATAKDVSFRDRVASAKLSQTRCRAELVLSPAAATHVLDSILLELEINQGQAAEMYKAVSRLKEALQSLDQTHLSLLPGELEQLPLDDTQAVDEVGSAIGKVISRQDHVIATLERLLADFSTADEFRQLRGEIVRVREAQRDLEQATRDWQNRLLAENPDVASRAEIAQQLAKEQAELARRWEQWIDHLNRHAARADAGESAQTSRDALARSDDESISADIRAAVEALAKSQPGEASAKQTATLAALGRLLDALEKRQSSPAEKHDRLAKLLADFISRAEAIRKAIGQQPLDSVDPDRAVEEILHVKDDLSRLKNEFATQAEATDQPATVQFQFGQAARLAREAIGSLERREFPRALEQQSELLARLQQLLAALKSDDVAESPEETDSADSDPENGKKGSSPDNLLELRLLRTLQASINRRTEELAQLPAADAAKAAADLAAEQASVTKLVGELSQKINSMEP